MADFSKAFPLVAKQESPNLTDILGDMGGLTYYGITYKNFHNWAGWQVIKDRGLKNGETLPEIDNLVATFYKENFWDRLQGDNIINQETANGLFCSAINQGLHAAICESQSALEMPQTGNIDNVFINNLNIANPYA